MPITEDVVSRFCPVFIFHPNEKFFPCSIDYLLVGSSLHVGQAIIDNPTQQTLFENFQKDNYVAINPKQYPGDLAHAPLYYAVQEAEDGSVQINYVPLYAFQGGQTCSIPGSVAWAPPCFCQGFNCIVNTYGQHQGDLERVAVKLVPSGSDYSIAEVLFEAHGNPVIYPKDQVAYDGEHPIVYVALNGHSSHNVKMEGYTTVDDDAVLVQFDSFMGDGTKWKAYESGVLTQIGLDALYGNPINNQVWAKFEGALGAPQSNSLTSGTHLDGSNLSGRQWAMVKTINFGAITILPGKIDSYADGKGPDGPGARPWIYPVVVENPNEMTPLFASQDMGIGTSAVQCLSASLQGQGIDSMIRFWDKNGQLAADVIVASTSHDHSFRVFSHSEDLASRTDAIAWRVADINGDGLDEVLQMIDYSHTLGINIFGSNGDPIVRPVWSSQNMGEGYGAVAWLITNLQGQQRQELVQLWTDGNGGKLAALVYATDGDKGLKVVSDVRNLGDSSQLGVFLVADLQGDGRDEIVQMWSDNYQLGVVIYSSDGGYDLRVSWQNTFSGESPGAFQWLVGDLNGDGRDEIVQCWQNGTQLGITLWGSDGQGGLQLLWKSYDMGEGYTAIHWSIGDFNGDGKAEVAQVWNNQGSVGIILYGVVSGNQFQKLWGTSDTHLSSSALAWVDGWYTKPGIQEIGQFKQGLVVNAGLNIYGNPLNLVDA